MSVDHIQPWDAIMQPTIYKAVRGSLGRVIRGDELTEAEAIAEYAGGRDVVVCGGTIKENRALAKKIAAAVGPYTLEKPHTRLGMYALPHFQPDPRPPDGHAFYESEHTKAALNP